MYENNHFKVSLNVDPTDKYEKAKKDAITAITSISQLTQQQQEQLLIDLTGTTESVQFINNLIQRFRMR